MRARVVIVGAGFAGLPTARDLARRLKNTEVVLIDRRPFFQFSPRLIDALATGDPIPALTASLERIAKRDGFRFLQGEATDLDREKRMLTVQNGKKRERLSYDLLVLATGCVMNDFGIPGVNENAFPLKTLTDVQRIQEHVRRRLREAKSETQKLRRDLLALAVIGGGAAGIEALYALRRFATAEAERVKPSLSRSLSFRLVEAAADILRGFPTTIVHGVKRELCRNGIALHLHDPVVRVESNAIVFGSGDRLASGATIWTAGIKPVVPQSEPSFHLEQGCLVTDRTLSVAPGILAAGDVVCYREGNVVIPKNAQTALHMSLVLSRNVQRMLTGGEREPYVYVNRGNLITLQRTGFIDLRLFTLKTRIAPKLRDLFYRWRFRQVTGNPD